MKYLLILHDPPYGSERSYNALRLATSLAKAEGSKVSVFLIGDAATAAVGGQATPQGYYNMERMLKLLDGKGAAIGVCGSCLGGRGVKPEAAGGGGPPTAPG